MTPTECRMLDMLKKGRDEHAVVAVKAEFEAEGTRPDEFLRLLEITRRADLKVALKIGGCEAISDLHAARLYGIDYIIAPMVETPYALSKFADARDKVYGADDNGTDFLFNLETDATLSMLDEMLPIARARVDGIVFGRVDFTLSRGLPRSAVNEREITDAVRKVAEACVQNDLDLVLGGSVAIEAASVLHEVRKIKLTRFETRKIIFDGAAAESNDFEGAIANATAFELAWLENKSEYYQGIATEDNERIQMMRDRVANAEQLQLISADS